MQIKERKFKFSITNFHFGEKLSNVKHSEYDFNEQQSNNVKRQTGKSTSPAKPIVRHTIGVNLINRIHLQIRTLMLFLKRIFLNLKCYLLPQVRNLFIAR